MVLIVALPPLLSLPLQLSGTPPFKGRRDREVLQAVRRGKYTLSGPKWDNVSEDAKDFIRHLLVYNPAKRMTAEQALKHAWLQQARHAEESRPLDPEGAWVTGRRWEAALLPLLREKLILFGAAHVAAGGHQTHLHLGLT